MVAVPRCAGDQRVVVGSTGLLAVSAGDLRVVGRLEEAVLLQGPPMEVVGRRESAGEEAEMHMALTPEHRTAQAAEHHMGSGQLVSVGTALPGPEKVLFRAPVRIESSEEQSRWMAAVGKGSLREQLARRKESAESILPAAGEGRIGSTKAEVARMRLLRSTMDALLPPAVATRSVRPRGEPSRRPWEEAARDCLA